MNSGKSNEAFALSEVRLSLVVEVLTAQQLCNCNSHGMLVVEVCFNDLTFHMSRCTVGLKTACLSIFLVYSRRFV